MTIATSMLCNCAFLGNRAIVVKNSLLGDDFFNITARNYFKQHSSAFRNLRWMSGVMTAQ